MKKIFLLTALMGLVTVGVKAQRVTDKLDRGTVAIPANNGFLVSWRKMGEEYYDTKYNLYRDGTKIASDLTVSNFQDAGGSASATYQVEAVVNGVVQPKSAATKAWSEAYFDVPVTTVVNRNGKKIGNSTTSGGSTTSGYTINDISLADVTGDGVCEFIVKRNNSQGNLRLATNTTDFNLYECYKLDGTRLWWIDLGPNLMAGADEQWDMVGYDWDQDGKAEMIMRGADNMIIHTATGKTINIGDMTAGFNGANRPEYMGVGNEYLLYLNGETGEPYGWDGSENWTPMAYPLPQFETGEEYGSSSIWGDLGHRMMKHYFGAPYLDGRNPSIFLGRGCYTRHKMCALDVNPATHELTQRWRWNCYDASSPWYGNGFHNFAIADVDMDGRDEIMFGSMCIDDTGYGLSTTGLGHGDAQHCGDLDPYRWGLEQFTCQEGSQGNSYWNPTTGAIYYRKSDGGDDGRSLAGNFTNDYPGGQGRSVSSGVIGLSSDKIINTNGDAMSGSYSNLNNRIYWDGDLLDEILNSAGGEGRPAAIFKWGGSRIWSSTGAVHNNSTKCNPSAQGDILGDWREEVVLRTSDNSAMRIFCTTHTTNYGLYTLWHDHEYRNGMCWQSVGYNQPPHVSFFLGELEDITIAPPPLMLNGRTEVANGATISTTTDHLLVSGYENKTIAVSEGASPYILTVNTPSWIKGTGSQQATAATPKTPARQVETFTTTLTGGAFSGAMRLIKQGEGILVLPNVVEKHKGETNVWNGTLQFDGTMESSPVWLNRHTTLITDGGKFMGGLKADYNATIYPGGQDKTGSITVSTLTLGFGSRVVFDVKGTDFDQTNATEIVVDTRDWSFGPKYKTPVFEFTGDINNLPAGSYELGSVTGVQGAIEDILLEGISGKRFFLEQKDNKLFLVLEDMREATTIVWNGTEENSIWDLAETKNFLNGTESVYAAKDDEVIFNDDAKSGNVTVKGAVNPSRITFNNETLAYTLTGDSILGGAPITKNGAAKVTINTENRTGNTIVNAGTLEVNALANNTGITYGALGDVKKKITLNDGTTFATSQPIITDQPFSVSGSVTFSIPTNLSFTLNKGLKGTGAIVTKSGAGTMTLGAANTFSQLIIKSGTVNAIASNNIDQLPATVEFQGGTLWGANDENAGIANRANFIVPKGRTGTFYASYRGSYTGSLTGEGTFNVYTGGIRCYFDGDWSQFSGTVNAKKANRQNKKSYDPVWCFRNTSGMPNATLAIDGGLRVSNEGKDIELGKVSAGANAGTTAATKSYLVGSGSWILTSNENASVGDKLCIGVPESFTVNVSGTENTVSKAASKLIKRGEGKLTILALGNINAPVTVEEGTLVFYDRSTSTSDYTYVNGTNATTVKAGARVVGQGKLYTVTLHEGAELIPCASRSNETTPGTIKSTTTITANAGSTINMLFNSSKQSKLECNNLTMNGTVKVTLVGGYMPKAGDEFTLWTVAETFKGEPTFELPELADGLAWNTDDVTTTGVLRVTQATGVAQIAVGAAVSCEVYTTAGQLVGRIAATRQSAQQHVQAMPLRSGTYIVKMNDGKRSETIKVVKR